jgi:hypothetical protein
MESILNVISAAGSQDLSFACAAVAMLSAIVFGLIISLTYIFTHKGSYQQSFAVTLTMLPVILAVIILFVGSNVARAFSLAGTLSIIRFRSAPGDPEDIGYIFFSIAAGLASGVGLYLYGALFVVVLCAFMIIIKGIGFGSTGGRLRTLKITVPEDLDYQGAFDGILNEYSEKHTLTRVKTTDLGSLYELVYKISLRNGADEKKFIDSLRCRNGNLNIVLSLAEEKYGA